MLLLFLIALKYGMVLLGICLSQMWGLGPAGMALVVLAAETFFDIAASKGME